MENSDCRSEFSMISMNQALESLSLAYLWIIYPGEHPYPLSKQISVWPMKNIVTLPKQLR
jgi:hypothetical protein